MTASAADLLYLAGDLARWLLNGNIEFLGRLDDQVKLRGFRIELGEVEAVLMEAPGVKLAAAIVMKDPSATDRLVGFVSPDSVDSEAIIAELKQRLPAHFVPSLIMPLPEMPLSPAGKVCLPTRMLAESPSRPLLQGVRGACMDPLYGFCPSSMVISCIVQDAQHVAM